MAKAVASAFKWVAKVGSIVGVTLLKTATKALTPKVPEIDSASQVNFRANPQAGVPRLLGRTATTGTYIYATVGEAKNRNVLFYSILSGGGPIQSFESFTMAGEAVVFDGADTPTSGTYRSLVWQRRQLGTTPQTYLQPPNTTDSAVLSEWDSTHATSGYAAAWYVLGADSKAYPNGVPDPLWVLKGVKCYDWRLDSTYPGGSGSHRINDRSTWTWTENPAVHAVAWCLGDIQNGKRVMGLGATLSQLAMSKFTEWANVCDANGWKVGGVVYSTDTKWQVLKAICQAGGAYPTALGAKISVIFNAPRVSIATLTGADFETEPSIVGTQLRRDRFNAAVPRYRSEDHKWQIVPGATLVVDSFVTADGGRRTKELEWPLVQNVNQATQLAAYGICNSRELGPLNFGVIPKWMGLEPGDCITIDEPEYGLTSQKVIVTGRSRSLGTFERSISCVTETDSKHAYCLGLSGTAPPTPSLAAVDPFPDAPDAANWSAVGGVQTGPTGSAPVITISGLLDDPVASAVIVDYRTSLGGGSYGDWASREWPSSSLTTSGGSPAVILELTGIAPSQPYEVRVRYRSGRGFDDPSTYLDLGEVTPGAISAATPGSNIVPDGGLRLRGQNWDLTGWTWDHRSDIGAYIFTLAGGTQVAMSAPFAVQAGAGYTASAFGGFNAITSGGQFIDVMWLDASDALVGYSSLAAMAPIQGDGSFLRSSIAVVAPTGAVKARLRGYVAGATFGTGGYALFYKFKVEGGPLTTWSDEATSGALYGDGQTIDDLQPGEIGANVTETRTASAIAGQGALATLNQAAWATQVTGVGKPEDYATKSVVYRQTTAPTTGLTVNDIWFEIDGGGNLLAVYAWTGSTWKLGADVTAYGVAAGFAGQGSASTLTPPTYAGNAAALAAGLLPGALFTDSTDGNAIKGVVTASIAPIALSDTDTVPSSGTTEAAIATSSAVTIPSGGAFRISGALSGLTNGSGNTSIFTLRVKVTYGGTTTTLATATCSIADDGMIIQDGLLALAGQLFANPGSGSATFTITRQRAGPSNGATSSFDLNALIDWIAP